MPLGRGGCQTSLEDKSLTQIVEEWIDSIPETEIENAKKFIEKSS
ncbi:hypothetical protein [Okeania sp. SIO2C9]|nr:hypothetical protein [Okeania sp. SIO2C9]